MNKTGADLLAATLAAHGVHTCFANPGTSEMHLVAALDRHPGMRCVLGLFEGVVTGAADGYARMAERPAATLLHLGPGLGNGWANLHNARRAFVPMVNIVGDHPDAHLPHDAPLASDIESIARPVSGWVRRSARAEDLGRDTAAAIAAAMSWPHRVATLILPADVAWSEWPADTPVPERTADPKPAAPDEARIAAAARALRRGLPTTLLLSGSALRAPALEWASRITRATGARLMAQQANARIERGAGRVPVERVPYVVDQALAAFCDTEQVILVGAKAPVAFFQYPGKPSNMLPPGCQVLELAGRDADLPAALRALAQALGVGASAAPELAPRSRPGLPTGALSPSAIAQALTELMPEGAIVCDESISSGRNFFAPTFGAAPHDLLQLTGGAIGDGLPLATGAAVACPERKVIVLEADGSGLYTLQAPWTQARERLDVLTIVFANRRYAILHGELRSVGAGEPGRNARRMLDLDDPAPDWVSLARGMGVEGARAEDAGTFADSLRAALSRRGPFLIEAVIPYRIVAKENSPPRSISASGRRYSSHSDQNANPYHRDAQGSTTPCGFATAGTSSPGTTRFRPRIRERCCAASR